MKNTNQILGTAVVLAAVPFLFPAHAGAHEGPRVWIGNVADRITTFTSDNDLEPTTYTPSRVFETTLVPFFGSYFTDFPGYEVRQDGGGVPTDNIFGFDLAGPVLVLDSPGNRLRESADAFPAPAPQLAITLGGQTRITSAGVQNGFDFFNYTGTGDHSHMGYTLLGNGASAGGGPDGVFVVPFLLEGSPMTRSDWYFLVFGKNAVAADMTKAHTLAQNMADARPGDANFDGSVNLTDFSLLAANFGGTGKWWGRADFNFDGAVNLTDFSLLAANFNQPGGSPRAVVPEPGALGLIGFASLLVRRRPRRAIPACGR